MGVPVPVPLPVRELVSDAVPVPVPVWEAEMESDGADGVLAADGVCGDVAEPVGDALGDSEDEADCDGV